MNNIAGTGNYRFTTGELFKFIKNRVTYNLNCQSIINMAHP